MFVFMILTHIYIKISLVYGSHQKNYEFWKICNFPNISAFLLFVLKTVNLTKSDILTSSTTFVHNIFATFLRFDRYWLSNDISNSNARGHNFKIKCFSVNNNINEFSNRSVDVWNTYTVLYMPCNCYIVLLCRL